MVVQLLRRSLAVKGASAGVIATHQQLQQCKLTLSAVGAEMRRWKSSQHNSNSGITATATATAQLRRSQAEALNARGGISTSSLNVVPTRLVFIPLCCDSSSWKTKTIQIQNLHLKDSKCACTWVSVFVCVCFIHFQCVFNFLCYLTFCFIFFCAFYSRFAVLSPSQHQKQTKTIWSA